MTSPVSSSRQGTSFDGTVRSDGADASALVTIPRLASALAEDARIAFGRADAIREALGRPGVGSDHLLMALYADQRAVLARAASAAGWGQLAFADQLRKAGFDVLSESSFYGGLVPKTLAPTRLEPMPPLASTVQALVKAAESYATVRTTELGPIGVQHLLAAFAAADALPVRRLFNDAWPLVTQMLASDDLSLGTYVVRELSDDELAQLVGSLSVSTRKALGVANALRLGRAQDKVHMEHLLVALHAEAGGHQHTRLGKSGLDAATIAQRLAKFELVVATSTAGVPEFTVPTAPPIEQMPDLSAHVRLALSAAAMLAGWRADGPARLGLVQARFVLAGWAAVRECSVVQALADRREAVRVAIAEEIRADEPPEGETTTSRLVRLDALLGEPPRVRWITLQSDAPPERSGAGGGGASDRPDGVDRLRFTHYIGAFADLIDSPDTDPPLTIGIFGAWGAGKSFLLRGLASEMRERRKSPRPTADGRAASSVHTVDFNAWEYNASPQIWPRLVRRILDEVESSLDWRARVKIRLRNLWPNLKRKLATDWKWIVAYGVIAAAIVALVRAVSPNASAPAAERTNEAVTHTFEFMIGRAIDKLTLPGIIGAITSLAALLVKSFIAPIGEWITAALDDGPRYGMESADMSVVRRDLERLDDRLANEGSRMLVVIDDLDRCEPEKAVEMLKAINLLLDRRSFVICLGIDARVVTAAVERHYERTLSRAGITGYEYLDKIVQIPFTIPEPTETDLAVFLAAQLDPAQRLAQREARWRRRGEPTTSVAPPLAPVAPTDTRSATPSVTPTVTAATETTPPTVPPHAGGVDAPNANGVAATVATDPSATATTDDADAAPVERFALSFSESEKKAFGAATPFLRRNPRHVKRLVNVYTLVRALATQRKEAGILQDPGATVLWLVLCAQWPYAVREMLVRLDRGTVKTSGATHPPLRMLLDATRPHLDPRQRARFDHDPALLDRLVDASGELSWDELHVLRAYTANFNPAIEGELRAAASSVRQSRRREQNDAETERLA